MRFVYCEQPSGNGRSSLPRTRIRREALLLCSPASEFRQVIREPDNPGCTPYLSGLSGELFAAPNGGVWKDDTFRMCALES